MVAEIEVRGLEETRQKMEQVIADLHGQPMLDGMREAALLVTRAAQANAPVDTGRLKNSITPEVRMEADSVIGVVGSNVEYAPYQELGTGVFAGRPRYFPPPNALETWARRHGMPSGMAVALAIWRRGGLRGQKYLQRAVTDNVDRVHRIIGDAVARIVRT